MSQNVLDPCQSASCILRDPSYEEGTEVDCQHLKGNTSELKFLLKEFGTELVRLRGELAMQALIMGAAEKMAEALDKEDDLCDELSEPLHTYHTAHWAHEQTRKALEKKP